MLSEHSIQLLMEIYQLHENMAGSEDEPDSLKYWEKDPISAGFTLKTFSEVRNIQPDLLSVEFCVSSVSAHPVEKWRSRPTTATQTVCWPSEWRRQSDAPSVSQERKRLDIVIIPSLSSLTNIFASNRWWQAARLQDICLLQKWNTENFYWQVQRSLGLWMFRGDDGRLYKEFQIRYFWLQVVG